MDHWRRALTICAAAQIAGMGQTDRLLALGVLDHRPAVLPGLYRTLLDEQEEILVRRPDGLQPAELAAARAGSALRERCERLAALAIPETIQHNDLHDRNVLVRDGDVCLADWGTPRVAHPFQMLGQTLHTVAVRWGIGEDDPALADLRETYLKPFGQMAPPTTLLAAARLAAPLGLLGGVLVAQAIVGDVGPDLGESLIRFEVEWLRRFLGT
ncbi:MAG: phosphotransferase [Dehalococcoidia bacterium]